MKRERVLSRVFEDAADGLLLLRADGVVVDCNPAAVALLGCADRAEILGRHLLDFSPEQQPDGTRSADLARDIMARIQAEGRACFEWEHRRFDGGPLYVEILIVAVDLPEGRVLHANWRDISRRRQMARDLTYRQSLEALIRRISSRFINLPADEVDAGIEQALGELGAFVEADRSYVFGYADGLMHNLYEWCADDIAPQIGRMQHIPVEAMSWSNTRIMRGDILNITDVGNLPDEAQAEEAEFALQGIRSVLVVPMERRGQ
ncbi:MAG: PAS domain-containing protein, partial [Chloroflexota bacterium]